MNVRTIIISFLSFLLLIPYSPRITTRTEGYAQARGRLYPFRINLLCYALNGAKTNGHTSHRWWILLNPHPSPLQNIPCVTGGVGCLVVGGGGGSVVVTTNCLHLPGVNLISSNAISPSHPLRSASNSTWYWNETKPVFIITCRARFSS